MTNESSGCLIGCRILIVDDVTDNIALFRAYLTASEAVVEAVMSGSEALSKLKTSSFDIVVMDIQMPEMDGLEAADKIKSLDFEGFIVACSAFGQSKSEFLAVNSSFSAFIPKPVGRTEFVNCLAELFAKDFSARAAEETKTRSKEAPF